MTYRAVQVETGCWLVRRYEPQQVDKHGEPNDVASWDSEVEVRGDYTAETAIKEVRARDDRVS